MQISENADAPYVYPATTIHKMGPISSPSAHRTGSACSGDIENGEMRLNDTGLIVSKDWMKTTVIRDEIELDA